MGVQQFHTLAWGGASCVHCALQYTSLAVYIEDASAFNVDPSVHAQLHHAVRHSWHSALCHLPSLQFISE